MKLERWLVKGKPNLTDRIDVYLQILKSCLVDGCPLYAPTCYEIDEDECKVSIREEILFGQDDADLEFQTDLSFNIGLFLYYLLAAEQKGAEESLRNVILSKDRIADLQEAHKEYYSFGESSVEIESWRKEEREELKLYLSIARDLTQYKIEKRLSVEEAQKRIYEYLQGKAKYRINYVSIGMSEDETHTVFEEICEYSGFFNEIRADRILTHESKVYRILKSVSFGIRRRFTEIEVVVQLLSEVDAAYMNVEFPQNTIVVLLRENFYEVYSSFEKYEIRHSVQGEELIDNLHNYIEKIVNQNLNVLISVPVDKYLQTGQAFKHRSRVNVYPEAVVATALYDEAFRKKADQLLYVFGDETRAEICAIEKIGLNVTISSVDYVRRTTDFTDKLFESVNSVGNFQLEDVKNGQGGNCILSWNSEMDDVPQELINVKNRLGESWRVLHGKSIGAKALVLYVKGRKETDVAFDPVREELGTVCKDIVGRPYFHVMQKRDSMKYEFIGKAVSFPMEITVWARSKELYKLTSLDIAGDKLRKLFYVEVKQDNSFRREKEFHLVFDFSESEVTVDSLSSDVTAKVRNINKEQEEDFSWIISLLKDVN